MSLALSCTLHPLHPPTMTRVYVGNLPIDVRERELDDLFYKYGRIRDIDIKRPIAPPAFAFITYDDHRGTLFFFCTASLDALLLHGCILFCPRNLFL